MLIIQSYQNRDKYTHTIKHAFENTCALTSTLTICRYMNKCKHTLACTYYTQLHTYLYAHISVRASADAHTNTWPYTFTHACICLLVYKYLSAWTMRIKIQLKKLYCKYLQYTEWKYKKLYIHIIRLYECVMYSYEDERV